MCVVDGRFGGFWRSGWFGGGILEGGRSKPSKFCCSSLATNKQAREAAAMRRPEGRRPGGRPTKA